MWRAIGSLCLTFVALAWAIVSIALCFFYLATLWSEVFGRAASFYAAVIAFTLCILSSRLLLRVADGLLEPYSGPFDGRAYEGAPRERFYDDWRRYSADIIRNRRFAFYSRTRQWDKLARVESEMKAAQAQSPAEPPPEPRVPRQTSIDHLVSWEERRRAVRRSSQTATVAAPRVGWAELDQDGTT